MEIAVWVEGIMDKKGSGRETAMLVKGMIQQRCWENGKSPGPSQAWCCDAGQEWAAFVVRYKRLSDILVLSVRQKALGKARQCELLPRLHVPISPS